LVTVPEVEAAAAAGACGAFAAFACFTAWACSCVAPSAGSLAWATASARIFSRICSSSSLLMSDWTG
jgi:hypothetical protein